MGFVKAGGIGGPIRVKNGKIIKRLAASGEILSNTFVQLQNESAKITTLRNKNGVATRVKVVKCSNNRALFAYMDYDDYIMLGVGHYLNNDLTIPTTWTKIPYTTSWFDICEYGDDEFLVAFPYISTQKNFVYRVLVTATDSITITKQLEYTRSGRGYIQRIMKIRAGRVAALWGDNSKGLTVDLFNVSSNAISLLTTKSFLSDGTYGADRGSMTLLSNDNLFIFGSNYNGTSSYLGGYGIVLSTSNDVLTAGTPVLIDSAAKYAYSDCKETNPNEIFVVYECSNDSINYAYLTITNLAITINLKGAIVSSGHGDGDLFRVLYQDGQAWVLGNNGTNAPLYCWICSVSKSKVTISKTVRMGAHSQEYGADMIMTNEGYIVGAYTYRIDNSGASTQPQCFIISKLAERFVVANSGITGITVNKLSTTKMGKVWVLK